MTPSVQGIESALDYFWTNYKPDIERIFMSLECAADSFGVDISEAPEGSICVISKDDVARFVMPEDCP